MANYDEMLAFREFLDKGEIFNFDVPCEQDDGSSGPGCDWETMRSFALRRGGPARRQLPFAPGARGPS